MKKFVIGVVVLLVVLAAGVFVLVPPIATRYVAGSWPVELPSGKGEAVLSDVRIGWGGPQRVGKVVVKDSAGKRMADVSVEARSSLLGLAMGGGNIGTVVVSGLVDVTEEQLARPAGAALKPTAAAAAAAGGGVSAGGGVEIPRGLHATLEVKLLDVVYTPRAGSGLQAVKITGLEAVATVDGSGTASVDVKAQSPTIDVKGSARKFVDGSGRLALAGAEGEIVADVRAPGELVEALARLVLNRAGGAGSSSAGAAATEMIAALKVAGGRLQLADATKPVTIRGPVPQAVMELLAGAGASVRIEGSPSVTQTISALSVPLPDGNGKVDLRGGVVRAGVMTTAITGTIAAGEGVAKAFRIEPVTAELASEDFGRSIALVAHTMGSFEGQAAGSVDLDAEVSGLLDAAGIVKKGVPGAMRAELKLDKVPTSLAEGLVRGLGVSLAEVVGPTASVTVTARTREVAGSATPALAVDATADAAYVKGRLALEVDESRARLGNEGLMFEASRAGAALRAFLKDGEIEVSGDGRAVITARDVSMPLMSGGLPDLGRASAVVEARVSGLTVTRGLGDRPVEVESLSTRVTVAADSPPRVAMDHALSSGGKPFTAKGEFELAGLIRKRDGEWPFVDVTPEEMRPSGRLELVGLPSDLLGYVPAELRSGAARSFGPDLTVTVTGARDPSGTTELTVAVKGEGLDAGGSLALDASSVRGGPEGLRARISRPGPVVQSFLQRQAESPVAGVEWSEALEVSLSGFMAALPKAGESLALNGVEGNIGVRSAGIGIDVRSPESGRVERVTVERIDAAVMVSKASGVSIKFDSRGGHAGESFTVSGDLALGRILGVKGVEVGALSPKGTVEAKGVPTALAAAFDAANGPLLREAAGPRVDVTVRAPSGDGGAGSRSAAVSVKGSRLEATSSFALAERTIHLGETKVGLTLTPALVDAAVSRFAANLSTKPSIAGESRVTLTVFPTSVDLDAANKPDPSTLRPVRAMLASADDLVLLDLPGGEGHAINAGVRGLEAGVVWVERDVLKREGSVKATIFEPSDPGARVATVEASGVIANPPPTFDVKLDNIDTARADAMLGRPGLLADLVGESAGVGLSGRARAGVQDVDVTVKSTRLETSLSVQRTRDSIRLMSPGSAELTVPAVWANRYLLGPGADGRAAAIQFAEAARLSVRLERLAVSAEGGPMKPGVFALEAKASSPRVSLRTADGQQVTIEGLSSSVRSDEGSRGVAFDLTTQQVGIGSGGGKNPVRALGTVARLADASGHVDASKAAITAKVTGTLPTAVVDALSNQDGALVDLLGATTALDLDAQDLSRESGRLKARMKADNAVAGVSGTVAGSRFSADEAVSITVSRITPALSARYLESIIPIISKVEKTAADEPAVITAERLTLPTDGDTRKINGEVRVDPGTMQFETSDFFGEIVKVAGGKARGQVGKRVKPFEFVAREGVVTYEKIELPLGEFAIETRGTVDLNTRRLDVVTFVPFYAVAEEIAGALANVPGIEKLTQIPIRTHGSLDNPKSDVQLDLLVTESVPGAIEKVIPEEVKKVLPPEVGDVLKDILKPKKDQKKP